MSHEVPFGPTGKVVYDRTYSRTKPNGQKETWPETVQRVAHGNLALVYGNDDSLWSDDVEGEYEALVAMMERFAVIPAGRHLWASGVKGRQYLFNCHVSGWGMSLSEHFEFTFLRLMEGGGVGANYSTKYLSQFGSPRRKLAVHIVCDPAHPDYQEMHDAGLLSSDYHYEWEGAFPVEDSREGWAAALVDLIDTYMTDGEVHHNNRVYDVSRVRAKGQPLRTFGGVASGPKPFAAMMSKIQLTMNNAGAWGLKPTEAMDIDHAIAECVVSGGNRRSARMAICHWDDPFIGSFLYSKADPSKNWTTNISVEVDDEFTAALADPQHPKHESAGAIHYLATRGMLTNGEPGYWNSSLSNVGEPNEVIATNPCGEIALEEWENCNLGHVNLDAFAPTEMGGDPDFIGLASAHALMTRFLIRATYGDVNDPKQAAKLARNRRIGVGHLGVQGFLAKCGIPYSEAPDSAWFESGLRAMAGIVRECARQYAFELRIPEPVKTTTVAPTGSIAKLPGVTEGIHPIYARHFLRRVRFSTNDPAQVESVEGFKAEGFEVEPDLMAPDTVVVTFPTKEKLVAEVEAMGYNATEMVESADEISLHDMLAFQAMYQEHWADNAVSYTVNVEAQPHQAAAMAAGAWQIPAPTDEYIEAVADTLAEYLPRLKGTTLMVDGSRPQAPYERISEADFALYEMFRTEDGTDEDCTTGACPVR